MSGLTRTLGIDLASQPASTAACLIEWGPKDATVLEPPNDPLTDSVLLELIEGDLVTKVGIDAPFGWPLEFVQAVGGYAQDGEWPVPIDDPNGIQASLVLRETDREVLRVTAEPLEPSGVNRTGKRPLSVTTNWIAYAAMRCARLVGELGRRQGRAVDRSGRDLLCEVYPDAALREWGLSPADWSQGAGGYKGKDPLAVGRRQKLVTSLLRELGEWLTVPESVAESWRRSDDHLDAALCALVARSVEAGASRPITTQLARAQREGWIHLPAPARLSYLAPG